MPRTLLQRGLNRSRAANRVGMALFLVFSGVLVFALFMGIRQMVLN
jgi:hypothetical protein